MAGVLIYAVSFSASALHETLQRRRSVGLPIPAADGDGDGDIAPPPSGTRRAFTLHDLKVLRHDWHNRLNALSAKTRGLENAVNNGWPVCWAGRATDYPHCKRARDEADRIHKALQDAVDWCKEQEIKKLSYLPKPRSRVPRPVFKEFPPSLKGLPWPIPDAPTPWDFTLVLPRTHRSEETARAVHREPEPGLPSYAAAREDEQVLLGPSGEFDENDRAALHEFDAPLSYEEAVAVGRDRRVES